MTKWTCVALHSVALSVRFTGYALTTQYSCLCLLGDGYMHFSSSYWFPIHTYRYIYIYIKTAQRKKQQRLLSITQFARVYVNYIFWIIVLHWIAIFVVHFVLQSKSFWRSFGITLDVILYYFIRFTHTHTKVFPSRKLVHFIWNTINSPVLWTDMKSNYL